MAKWHYEYEYACTSATFMLAEGVARVRHGVPARCLLGGDLELEQDLVWLPGRW